MRPRDLASVLFAALGVYLLGAAIIQLGTAIFLFTLESSEDTLGQFHADQALASSFLVALEMGFASALLVFRNQLASVLFANDRADPPAALRGRDLQATLFAVVGIYFVVEAVGALVQGFMQLAPRQSLRDLWPNYASSLIEAVFGLALFLGARGLSTVWLVARRAGHTR